MTEGKPAKKKLRQNRAKTPEFEVALSRAERDPRAPQPHCKTDPGSYWDYVSPPPKEVAKAMCEPCPLLTLCVASARYQRPAWGVQGGIAWEYGRQSHWLKKSA